MQVSATVVIPVYNRPVYLEQCLLSVMRQTYAHQSYAIFVVDDGSTDNTATVARRILQSFDGEWRVLRKANGGPASARNAGIREATSDVVAFLDSDCVADANWLGALVAPFADDSVAGVGGTIRNAGELTWISRYLIDTNFFRHRERDGRVEYLLTANVAFRRSVLVECGGFLEQPGVWCEDADLSFRLIHAGYVLLLAPDAGVTHFGTPASIGVFARDLYRYGRGNAILSGNWHNGRSRGYELIRHSGAIVLSPWLALSHARRSGLLRSVSFWPLVVIEHTSFVAGLTSGWIAGGGQDGRDEREHHHGDPQ